MIHIHITIVLAFLVFALHFGAHAIPITTTTDLDIPGSTGSPSLPRSAPTLYPPPAANPPGANPTSANPPSANPPSANPPSANPPGANPPSANPPGANPPSANPPGANPGNDGDSPGPTYQDAPPPSLTPAIPASTMTVITTVRETEYPGTMFIK
ncbi:2060_t:CDS:2 [Paraglomus occultum]|uniref:2060_t:CDS:1 n=1 Tax=Paraglomus occultum TaxID=144539 RepID=A0A9N9C5W5_9GLOM|nr:2060_t:CDS:2 [Paraglomus occultum]